MAHTYHQNFGHLVFHVASTPIHPNDTERLHAYIAGIARNNRVDAPIVGGTDNHIHLLGNFPVSFPVSELVSKIKASSSVWLKSVHTRYHDFSWQKGYGYFSVSASLHARVADYIKHQEKHHAHLSAEEEFTRLLEKHGLSPANPPAGHGASKRYA